MFNGTNLFLMEKSTMKKLMFCGLLGLLLLLLASCVYYDDYDYNSPHHHGAPPSGHWERGYHPPNGALPSPSPQYRDRGF